jgi:hypothetical protein
VTVPVVFNILVITSCELLEVSGDTTLGLFKFKPGELFGGGDCREFEEKSEDPAVNCARVCSVMALIFGTAILFFGFFKQCLCKLPLTKLIMDLSGLGIQICMALVYVAWRNDVCETYGCEWGKGITFNLCAQICYLAASCLVRCMREPRYERRKDEPPKPEPPKNEMDDNDDDSSK